MMLIMVALTRASIFCGLQLSILATGWPSKLPFGLPLSCLVSETVGPAKVQRLCFSQRAGLLL